MFFLTRKMEEDLTQIAYEDGYNDGVRDAQLELAKETLSRANKALEKLEDENRRLEQVFKWAYQLGSEDALARNGIVEIEDEVKDE